MSHFSAYATSIIQLITAEKNTVTKSILWRFFDIGTVEPIDVLLTHKKVGAPKARAKITISFKWSTNFNMTHYITIYKKLVVK